MSDQSTDNNILLVILWPFAGLVSALRNWRQPWAMNVFWGVCIFLGAIQIFQPNGEVLGSAADGGRYVLSLQDMHRNVTSFSEVSKYFFDGHTNDVFADTLTYLISRITDNGHFFFMVLAVIFGFFYSRNVWYVLRMIPESTYRYFGILIAALFLVCPIWEINGVRMWTALHIFVYGALPFLVEGDKKKLLWCAVSLLVHQAFILPLLIIILFAFLPQRFLYNNSFLITIFVVYLVSLTVNSLNLTELNGYLQRILPSYYDYRIEMYIDEAAQANRLEATMQTSLYVTILTKLKYYVIQVLIILSFVSFKNNDDNDFGIARLFVFSLLFYALANILSCVPSGARYITIANMLMIPAIMSVICYCNFEGTLFQRYFPIFMICLCVSLLYDIRIGMSFYGYNLVFGNYITASFLETDVPIIDFIKQIL